MPASGTGSYRQLSVFTFP